MAAKRIFHVISNTHWDREWRFPFQKNRQMLVEMLDKTLEILASAPEYRAFHLDSQSIVLEDYLAIRPEKKALIRQFVQEKRLIIGPWFILPDEFQVGGESLVRNLLLGHRICAEFGPVMKVGYSPFSWGQISQLPQLYQEFGIDVVMFYRGINSLDSPRAEFTWEGADGTRVLASRFSTMPRYNFYFYIYRPVIHNEQVADVEYSWLKGGLPFHFADADLKDEDYSLLQPLDQYHRENLAPAVAAIVRDQAGDFTTPHIFWAEGHDSSGPNVKTVQIIKEAAALLPEDEVVHSTLEDYVTGLKQSAQVERLTLVRGERRSSQYDRRSGNLYGYTTSARMYLKQINFTSEKWLQFYAEPFNSLAHLVGLDTQDRYLDLAWHLLLQNSAHDSIGGCSLDEVHADMISRYKQCQEIARGVFARACKHLVRHIDLNQAPENSIHLAIFNPLTFDRAEVAEAFVDIPQEMDRGSLQAQDLDGSEIPVQMIESHPAEPVLEQMIDRPMYFKMKRYHCYLAPGQIPALGFKTIRILPLAGPKQVQESLVRMENELPVLENRYLKVSVQSNGAIAVLDKRTGHSFNDLGYFCDQGEAGHAWVHQPEPPVVDTMTARPLISIKHAGPLAAICSIRHQLQVPATLKDRRSSGQTVTLPIDVDIILKQDAPLVELQIRLENQAESHRLRCMFPLGLKAEHSYGEGQFDVVARSSARPDTRDWIEQPMYDYPIHHFVAVSDAKIGAAVLVAGLKEYELLDDAPGTLAITLLRAFSYIIQPSSVQDYSLQKGSQCLGQHSYRLAFYPHAGRWDNGRVYPTALAFNNELRLAQFGRATGTLAPETSFISIEPDQLIFSCFKPAEHGRAGAFILRIYNPTDQDLQGRIRFHLPLKQASQVTLEEKFIRNIPLSDAHSLECEVARKKITTFELRF